LRAAAYCGPIAPLLVKQAIEQSAEKFEKFKRKFLTATKLTNLQLDNVKLTYL
jgi:hypothetical protein